jgi:hypothetical protein
MDKLNIMLVKNLKKGRFGFCPSMGPGASSAKILKVPGLQVMDEGELRTRPGSRIPSCYFKRKEKLHEKESKKGIKQKFCSSNLVAHFLPPLPPSPLS